MAFYTNMSKLIDDKPRQAYRELKQLFAAHGGHMRQLAAELGVSRVTVHRWVCRLVEGGYGDPRGRKRGRKGRKPATPGATRAGRKGAGKRAQRAA